MLTKKGKYGLKAMVHLAGLEPDELAQVANIAKTNSISKKFLDHILSELKHAGPGLFKEGQGWRLCARPPGALDTRGRDRRAPSMVPWRRFHVLWSPHFAPVTTAAISNRVPSV